MLTTHCWKQLKAAYGQLNHTGVPEVDKTSLPLQNVAMLTWHASLSKLFVLCMDMTATSQSQHFWLKGKGTYVPRILH